MKKTDEKQVWVLADELGSARRVFADLDDEAILATAAIVFDEGAYEFDEELPDSEEEVASGIKESLRRGEDEICFMGTPLALRSVRLNSDMETGALLFDDSGFEVVKGAVVWEAVFRESMGCGMDYVLQSVAFCTREADLPDIGCVEWIEHKLA